MAKKSFERVEVDTIGNDLRPDGGKAVSYEPTDVKWFKSLSFGIKPANGENLPDKAIVMLMLPERWKDLPEEKKTQLRHLTSELRRMGNLEHESSDYMSFNVPSISALGSLLDKAEFPKDMQVEIMDELRQIYPEPSRAR